MAGTGKTMAKLQAYANHKSRKEQALFERKEKKKAITLQWKEGFAALKAENDRMQAEMETTYRQAMKDSEQLLQEELADVEELQP